MYFLLGWFCYGKGTYKNDREEWLADIYFLKKNAFAKAYQADDKVIMAGDGSALFANSLGLTQDLTKMGMGIRSKRFAIVIDDLVVKYIGVENAPGVTSSGAEAVLAKL